MLMLLLNKMFYVPALVCGQVALEILDAVGPYFGQELAVVVVSNRVTLG